MKIQTRFRLALTLAFLVAFVQPVHIAYGQPEKPLTCLGSVVNQDCRIIPRK